MNKKNTPEVRFKGYTNAWEQRKLSQVATLTSSKRVHAVDYVDSGIPFYRGKEITELRDRKVVSELLYITKEKYEEIDRRFGSPEIGDILITAVGTIGNTWVVDKTPFYFKDGNLIWFKNIKCAPTYLDYVLSSPGGRVKVMNSAIGSNQKALTMVKLNEIEITIPSIEEQERIGAYFKTLDNLITLYQHKYDKLIIIKKSMLENMFPQEGESIPQVRFTGFGDAWERCKVGDFYYFKNGLNKGKEYFGYGIPIVNFTDVFHNRGITASSLKGKVDLSSSEVSNYNVRKGDIFFTRTSETIDDIGRPSVMLDNPIDAVYSGFVLRARAIKDDPLDLNFKSYVFFTDIFRKEMIKKSSITTRALTSGTAIKNMEFQFPKDKCEQSKIGTYFKELDELITFHQHKLEKLKKFKKSCLEKMFIK